MVKRALEGANENRARDATEVVGDNAGGSSENTGESSENTGTTSENNFASGETENDTSLPDSSEMGLRERLAFLLGSKTQVRALYMMYCTCTPAYRYRNLTSKRSL